MSKVVLDVVELPAGSVHVLHCHPSCERVTYALKGSSLHLREGGKMRVNEGDAVFVEQGEWHGIENDTDEAAVVLISTAELVTSRRPATRSWPKTRSTRAVRSRSPTVRIDRSDKDSFSPPRRG